MTTVNVQFADSTEKVIVAFFGCPQDSNAYPDLGVVETSDARWSTFYYSLSSDAQRGLPAPTPG